MIKAILAEALINKKCLLKKQSETDPVSHILVKDFISRKRNCGLHFPFHFCSLICSEFWSLINFGCSVCLGMDVVTAIAAIPTFRPSEKIQQFNDFAEFLGDERAGNARALWNKPLKTIYISDCGELKVAKPSLSPSLPWSFMYIAFAYNIYNC